MFIPVHTDAPIYHRPIGTFVLIILNVIAFIKTSFGMHTAGWVLQFGNGLHPSEWVYSAFFHFGTVHLVGNMIFLWAFGLLIEGKLGLAKFLTLYVSLCLLTGFLIQLTMLNVFTGGGAGGASTVLFALMSICLLWAPQNSFETVWFYSAFGIVRAGSCQLAVTSLAAYYLLTNLFFAWLTGFRMSSESLHLSGAVIGVPVGILFLKQNWVDCEGWDLLTLWKKDLLKPGVDSFWGWKGKSMEDTIARDAPAPRASNAQRLQKILKLLKQGNAVMAVDSYIALRDRETSDSPLTVPQLRKMIEAARTHDLWKEAAWLLQREYLPLQPTDRIPASLILGIIFVQHLQRPRAALQAVAGLAIEELNPRHRAQMASIKKMAQAQIEEGVMELPMELRR